MTDLLKTSPENQDLIQHEENGFQNYKPDQTVICNIKDYQHVSRSDYKISPSQTSIYDLKCMPYSFYSHIEYHDIKIRLEKILDMERQCDENVYVPPTKTLFGDNDAEEKYLNSKPVSFLILGKPGVGKVQLANQLADYWKCININPQKIIEDEIKMGTRAGQCIEFNLKHGRAIEPEVLLRLAERLANSEAAQHRGIVVSGFPMIPNLVYKPEPLSSESAMFAAEDIFEDLLAFERESSEAIKVSLASSTAFTELESAKDASSSTSTLVQRKVDSKDFLLTIEDQIYYLFKLFSDRKFLFIYIGSKNKELLERTKYIRYDYLNKKTLNIRKDLVGDSSSHTQFYFGSEEDLIVQEGNAMKRLFKLPHLSEENVTSQLDKFILHIMDMIESKILNHDPQYFIFLDGRLSVNKLFNTLRTRIITLGIQPVLIPQKLVEDEIEIIAESGAVPKDKTTIKSLMKRKIVGPMFKWRLSHFKDRCPVALKEGKVVQGTYENAVSFMDKIFLLSSEEALKKFQENPRRFLLPVKPRIPCKLWIVGPDNSGKTAVSHVLSFLYKANLLDPKVLKKQYSEKKKIDYLEKIRMTAITEALNKLNKKREADWHAVMQYWKKKAIDTLKQASNYCHINSYTNLEEPRDTDICFELQSMNLPTDLNLIHDIIKNDSELEKHLPKHITSFQSTTIFDPFVTEYVNNLTENLVLPNFDDLLEDELVHMYSAAIGYAEEENGAWVIDGLPLDLNILRKIEYVPYDVICLIDKDPEDVYLQAKYVKDTKPFNEYQEFFTKYTSKSFLEDEQKYYKEWSAQKFIDHILTSRKNERLPENTYEDDVEYLKTYKDLAYAEHLADFREKWKETKHYLEKCNIQPIELNIHYKDMCTIMKEANLLLDNLYKIQPKRLSDEDRIQEIIDFGGGVGNVIEEIPGEMGDLNLGPNIFEQNRRFGVTNQYCPVAFHKNNVLWKGKEEFAISYEDKTYLLSCKAYVDIFLNDPVNYVYKFIKTIPPPRICVTGCLGSGKTTLCKKIALNLGLYYVNFDSLLWEYFGVLTNKPTHELLIMEKEKHELLDIRPEVVELVRKYITEQQIIPEKIIYRILNLLWFRKPYRTNGFILDGYPRGETDVKYMISKFFIPDIVIKLDLDFDRVIDRIMNDTMKQWSNDLEENKILKEQEYRLEYAYWSQLRKERTEQMMKTLRQVRQKGSSIMTKTKLFTTPTESSMALEDVADEVEAEVYDNVFADYEGEEHDGQYYIFHPGLEEDDIDAINNTLDEELPPPKLFDQWETYDEAQTKILKHFQEIYAMDIKHLDTIKHSLVKENIEFVEISALKSADKLFYTVSRLVDKFKFRNISIFERVYEISVDDAERLLECGYYLMSSFGRTCPVQIYENKVPIQMYLPSEYKMNLFPVIHRKFIYFIVGETSLLKFKNNPLLYVNNKNWLPLLPFKIAIAGPPNSGKTTLAEHFKYEFGIKIISIEAAINHVLKNMEYTYIAKVISAVLKKGWTLTPEMLARVIQVFSFDVKSITQGYVIDDFPCDIEFMKHCSRLGVSPRLIFVTKPIPYDDKIFDEPKYYKNTKNLYPNKLKGRYTEIWNENFEIFKEWIHIEYQNMHFLELSSKWSTWTEAKKISYNSLGSMVFYMKNRHMDIVFPLKWFNITPDEFKLRCSNIKSICPCCIQIDQCIVDSGKILDRRGLYQFRDFYFWVCKKHEDLFKHCPEEFLPPYSKISKTPIDFPFVYTKGNPHMNLYEDGLCIVSFWDNQPKYVIVQGKSEYVVSYKTSNYQFCSEECMAKFLKNPDVYYNKQINFKEAAPLTFDLSNLPTLGFLEQYVADTLTKVVAYTEILRPVLPGLNISQAASIYIGLNLKMTKAKTETEKSIYKQAMDIYNRRRNLLLDSLDLIKHKTNPFAIPEM